LTTPLFIPGIPYGQPRPLASARYSKASGKWHGHVHDDKEHPNQTWKATVRRFVKDAGWPQLAGAVEMELEFVFKRPGGHVGKRGLKPSAPVDHIQKPDLDNLEKSVKDALNGVAWLDDCQVVSVVKVKRWARPGEPCGLHLEIHPCVSHESTSAAG